MTELVLVRHGESVGNVAAAAANLAGAEVIQAGYRDPDVPLSPVGLEQATALGRGLAQLLADGLSTQVWASPYERALHTAEQGLAAAGAELAIIVDERLRDRELGVLDLLTRQGVANRFPLEAQRRQWWGKFYHRPPGGESWADVTLRLRSFLRDLGDFTEADRAVLVVHDAVVMLFRYLCEGLDEHTILEIGATDPVRNVSLTVLRRQPGGPWQLVRYNDVSHLVATGAPVTAHPGEPDVAR
ncbi:MAG: histidine phosphatase family protein [Propionibacteriaceae bacterium]|nr:histidine phosphatase family protein [Propionibacteriaceae bacterium]